MLVTVECLAKKRIKKPKTSINPKSYKEKTNFKLITEPAFLPNTCYSTLLIFKMNYMTPKEKAEELYKKVGSYNKQTTGLSKGSFSPVKAIDIALVAVDEVLGVLRYFNEENAFREDIKKKYWHDVKRHLKDKLV